MDELSRQLAAAIKAKQANDLRKQLERQQARIKGCGANAVIIRSLEALASDADSKIKDQDIAGAKAAIRKLTDQLDKISPEIDPRQQDAEAGEAYTDANGKPASALAIWRDAKETVDTGISALQDRMRAHPLKALGRIADAGLAGITSREAVGMMVAVTEAERSTTAAAPAVAKATAALRAFLATDAAAAIDENPFGVQVNLRATMQSAMSAIERSVGI